MLEYLIASQQYKGFHYSLINPKELHYLQRRTLYMLKRILEIFEKNNIEYFIEGGTLLGAVTRQRFIPWDDDIDIVVLQKNYNKAIEVLERELTLEDEMLVQSEHTEPNYFHDWIKIRDLKSETYPVIDGYSCNGVWIDIYPADYIKENCVEKEKISEHIDYLCRRARKGMLSKKEFLKRFLYRGLLHKYIYACVCSKLQHSDREVLQLHTASRMVLELEWIYPLRQYTFEGLQVCGINDADAYLERHYGKKWRDEPLDELKRCSICGVNLKGGGGKTL